MNCSICDKEMSISDGLTEFNGKRCHVDCKKQMNDQWRKIQGLDRV